ncbi:SDR family NAD(P)-dependent oxidoreductase [Phenylobacterium koreense]|uniref:NAD(P)-dependent dehydrogenase (Short-subunit alcohol dehydrogenase family) n=1 Tax=Phenylobacterium koreense TaxID=266125 RepID=A0ABV2EN82_9CAUL
MNHTLITTPFGFTSAAADVLAGVDLTGRRAIVTGGASGIGLETARALAAAGAEVTLAVRRPEAAGSAIAELKASTGSTAIYAAFLDLARLETVTDFVDRWRGPVDMLINNAGIMALPELERSPQGCELQFATNFVGHFALALGLHEALKSAGDARVVSVSSSANLMGPMQFDDPHFRFLTYDPYLAYAQSKTAAILFAVEAGRRWAADGICVNALNPGAIATNLQRHTGGLRAPVALRKSPPQGAATSVLLAASPHVAGVSGRYFEDCSEASVLDARSADFRGVARYALDAENAARLWDLASDLL